MKNLKSPKSQKTVDVLSHSHLEGETESKATFPWPPNLYSSFCHHCFSLSSKKTSSSFPSIHGPHFPLFFPVLCLSSCPRADFNPLRGQGFPDAGSELSGLHDAGSLYSIFVYKIIVCCGLNSYAELGHKPPLYCIGSPPLYWETAP